MLEIKILDKIDNIENNYIFNDSLYLELNQNIKIIHIYKDNCLLSIIPIEIKHKLFLKIGKFVYEPFPENSQEIIDEVIVFLKNTKLIDFVVSTPNYIPFEYKPKNSTFCNFGTYRIDLTKDEDELFKNLHSKHRNVIRKCQKENLEIKSNNIDILNDCFLLFKDTMNRSAMDYPSYDELKYKFDKIPDNIYCSVVYKDTIPQGAIYLYFNKNRAYYIYGGSVTMPFTGAMNFLHWDAMKTLKKMGVESYDFVGARVEPTKGSKTEGIQRFKVRFGADMYKGYMWKYIFNKPKYFIYIFLLKLSYFKNRKKYLGDIIDQENSK